MADYFWFTFLGSALFVGYPLVRGVIDWRDGRRRLGALGIGFSIAILSLSFIPLQTQAIKIDLPAN